MAVLPEVKAKVEAELALGAKPKELAIKYNVTYSQVLSWRKRINSAKVVDNNLSTLVEVDEPTLVMIADKVKEEAPAEVANKIDKLVDGVVGLQQLEPRFHAVVLNLLEAAEEMSMREDLSVKDWKMLGDGIGNLYTSIFNKSGVNVNVMNQTNVNNEKLSLFKASMR